MSDSRLRGKPSAPVGVAGTHRPEDSSWHCRVLHAKVSFMDAGNTKKPRTETDLSEAEKCENQGCPCGQES
jgi:hypothetical protein